MNEVYTLYFLVNRDRGRVCVCVRERESVCACSRDEGTLFPLRRFDG